MKLVLAQTTSSKCHALVTSSFRETKGLFCFSFNKRSPEDALGKIRFFAYLCNISKMKQTSKKHAEHGLTHLNKTACEIWSVFDKVHTHDDFDSADHVRTQLLYK